jgi:hypothetical protein
MSKAAKKAANKLCFGENVNRFIDLEQHPITDSEQLVRDKLATAIDEAADEKYAGLVDAVSKALDLSVLDPLVEDDLNSEIIKLLEGL